MEYNYQKKHKHTKIKLVISVLAILLPIIAFVILGSIYDFVHGEQALDLKILRTIVLIVFEAVVLDKIVLYSRILASKDFANNYFIKKHDERNVYIKQRTTSFSLKLALYLMGIGMLISGFIDQRIFYTLLIVILSTLIIYLLTYLYFKKKY